MPIDFPIGPATGQTYSYGINRWIYNGVAWDKLDSHPGISAGNQISVGYQESLSGASFSVNVIEGSGSDLDADLLDGVSGERFIENLQTGLLYGGLLSINSGNTATFDITAGSGIIVTPGGSTYSYPSPTVNYVSWSGASGLTLSGLTTYDITYISMNSSGNILQNHTPFTVNQYDSQIPIGALIHPTKSYISFAKTYPHVAYGQGNQMDGFVRAFGPLKLSGHEITGYPGTLQLSRSSGSAYDLGRNYPINPNSPNVVNDTDSNPTPIIYRQYRGATAGSWITVINSTVDATNYDDGSGTLNSVAGGRYTIQRVFYYPTEPTVLLVYYGRVTYNSIDTAKAALFFEEFSESDDSADSAIFCAYLIVKSGIANFSSTGDYEIVQAGLFRSTANIGGGGVAIATLDDLSDVSITSVANNQALIYDSSSGDWVNKSFSDLPVVTSFNGSTGAIVGVNSVRGLTGAIGITNSSGIGLSVSGQTMSFSNTGVLSIDGGTGAITNVARTNVNNNFTVNQSINPSLEVVDSDVTGNYITIIPASNQITSFQDVSASTGILQFSAPSGFGYTVTLPPTTTVLAGLSAAQTFTNTNTFNTLTNFPGGISAAGATFSSLVRFNAGISAAGGTFSSQARFLSGITVAGGATFATDISVNGMRVGLGAGNKLYNVALGAFTLTTNTIGNYNLAIGASSLELNIDGTDNIALGYASLNSNSSGLYNVGVGSSTLFANSSGSNNSAIGVGSLGNISTGNDNVGIGYRSLGGINLGRSQNTAIGSQAGYYRGSAATLLLGATGSIYIGYQSRASANAQTNEIVIGTQAVGLGSNTAVIGATAQTAATIYGLLNATSGISAPGGTFSALTRFTSGISAAGGTFSGTQTFVNGATFSSGINVTGNVTATGALIGYQQINAQTGTAYTAVLSDVSKLITLNNASGITMTIPLNSSVAFPTGTVLYFAQLGVGQVGFTGASGVTLNFTPGRFLRTRYSTASAIQLSTNIWLLSGDLTA
jgi:hypothetical protein